MKQKEREERERKEAEERSKAEEEKKMIEKYSNPDVLKELVRSKLKHFSDMILEKIQNQEVLKNTQKKLLTSVMEMQIKLVQLEQLEDEAALHEEFEEAAKYHDELEKIKELCKVNHEHIQSNSSQYSHLESDKSSLLRQKRIWIEETLETSQNALNLVQNTLETNKKNAENVREAKVALLAKEISIVNLKEEETLRIASSVNEQKTELNKRILEKTESIQCEERKLSQELRSLKDEIQNLEEILAKKKAEAIILSKNLISTQESLEKSKKEFEEETFEVEEAEKVLQSELDQVSQLQNQYKEEESVSLKAYNEFMKHYNTKIIDLEIFTEELKLLREEGVKIDSLQENRGKYLAEIQGIENILKEKEENLWDAQEYYSSTKDNIDQFKEHIRQQEEKIKDIDKRIPILENDKKTAASAKLFKVYNKLGCISIE